MANGRQVIVPGWAMGIVSMLIGLSITGMLLMWRDSYASDLKIEDHEREIEKHEERLDAMERVQIKTENHLENLDDSFDRIVIAVEKIADKVE